MDRNDKLEHLIKKALRQDKGFEKTQGACLSEEQIACFLEGKLSTTERGEVDDHVLSCRKCGDILRDQMVILKAVSQEQQLSVPEAVIERAKGLVTEEAGPNILDIVLTIKETALEILRTTGDILRGPEPIPLYALRGQEKGKDTDQVRVVKNFQEVLADIQIEKKKSRSTDLTIRVTEKTTKKKAQGIRVSLVKDNREIESRNVEGGKAKFEEVKAGNYKVILVKEDKKIGIITLLMN